jgi:hypothetical protein
MFRASPKIDLVEEVPKRNGQHLSQSRSEGMK